MTRDESMSMGEYEGFIVIDEDPQNPRTDRDNFGRMVCCHKRYNLGDDDVSAWVRRSGNVGDWAEIEKYLREEEGAAMILPVSLTDHSAISMSVGVLRGWDCGQVGFIYVTAEAFEASFPELTGEEREAAVLTLLEDEVAEYDAYLRGDVYGWQILDRDGNHVEGCFGFYGQAGRDTARDEMRDALARLAGQAPRSESETAHFACEC